MQMETTYYGMVNNLSILLGKVPSEPIRGKGKAIPLHIVIEQLWFQSRETNLQPISCPFLIIHIRS
jgi:hypothetical protein